MDVVICIPNWTDLSRMCSFWGWWYHGDNDTVEPTSMRVYVYSQLSNEGWRHARDGRERKRKQWSLPLSRLTDTTGGGTDDRWIPGLPFFTEKSNSKRKIQKVRELKEDFLYPRNGHLKWHSVKNDIRIKEEVITRRKEKR